MQNQKVLMIAHTNPTSAEREAEYNEWYDKVHLREVLSLPGYTAATRYRLSSQQPGPLALPRYAAIYEVETDNIQSSLDELVAAVSDGRLKLSDALEMSPSPMMAVYELCTPRVCMTGLK